MIFALAERKDGHEHSTGVYNLLNKTRIWCGKITETFWGNVEAYSKTAKYVYFEIVEACGNVLVSRYAFTFHILMWVCGSLDTCC